MHIIVVDDETREADGLGNMLKALGHEVKTFYSGLQALEISDNELQDVDVAILDQRMPNLTGLETGEKIIDKHPRIYLIMLTAYGHVEGVVEAMDKGFNDYLEKPSSREKIQAALTKAELFFNQCLLIHDFQGQLLTSYKGKHLIGESPAFREVLKLVQKVANTNASVLILGKSGTGKELIAHSIHQQSKKRAQQPFIAVNCAALPENLLESELFGHEKGAFTGADSARNGRFGLANLGTLFLDEIGDMPLSLQPKLLRVLQEKEVEKLGSQKPPIPIDIRVIAATSKDLYELVEQGEFSDALLYRLNAFQIPIPLLRERREDIPALAKHFLKIYNHEYKRKLQGIQSDAMEALQSYEWPGNVRELEHAIERAVILAQGRQITKRDLTFPSNTGTFEGGPTEGYTSKKEYGEEVPESGYPENDILEPEKARVVARLDRYESGFANALKNIEDGQKIRLEDIGKYCNRSIKHPSISQFFNAKKKDLKIIRELAKQFPDRWPLLRTLKQWPSQD